jgi:hypothetical protein
MTLRSAILAIALVMGTPAYAQEEPQSADVASQRDQLSPEHIAAGENLFRAIILDGGALNRMFEVLEAQMLPGLRTDIISSPIYQAASPQRREAIMLVIDDLTPYMRREITAEMGIVGARVAPRFAQRMSLDHLNETAEFMRSPEMRERWRAMVDAHLEDEKPMPSFPDWRTAGTFAATPAGLAFAQEADAFGDILDEESERALALTFPRMLTVIAGRICDALADDCPAHIRDAAGRI